MAVPRMEYVDLPYAGRRYTPDTSRLSALISRGGEQLADLSLQRGQVKAQLFDRLSSIFSGYQELERGKKATAAAMEMRGREREEDRGEREREREADRTARSTEKAEANALRMEQQAQAESVAAERAATAAVDRTRPGVVSPAIYKMAQQFPSLAARFQVQDGAPVLMESPDQNAARVKVAADAAARDRDDRRMEAGAADTKEYRDESLRLQREALNARTSGGGDNEPLATIIGPDGKPIYVRRRDAIGKSPTSGTEKPSSGVQKRVLNFFNRAAQADIDTETMEAAVQKLDLGGQTWMKYAPNFAQTKLGQQYTQAQRAFTEARLRKDSGAAIPTHEYDADRMTYFAQPGDDQETLAQKRRGRAAVLASLAFESGQALGEFLGSSEEAAAVTESYKARAMRPTDKTRSGSTAPSGGVERWERGPDGKPRKVGG